MSTKNGFTLIEVLVALFILTVGIVGIWFLFPVGIRAAGRSIGATVTTNFAEAKIAELQAKSGSQASPGPTDWTKFEDISVADPYLAEYRDYLGYEYRIVVKDTIQVFQTDTVKEIAIQIRRGQNQWNFLTTLSELPGVAQ